MIRFKAVNKRLRRQEGIFRINPTMTKYTVVTKISQLKSLAKRMEKIPEFAFDTETNTLEVYGENKNFKLVGISISWGYLHNYYIPTGHVREEDLYNNIPLKAVRKYLKPVFERLDVRVIGHNLKFDMHVMDRVGVLIRTKDLFDTMIASWMCDENTPNGLKENSTLKLKIDQTHFADVMSSISKEIKKSFGLKANSKATFDLALISVGAPYALADSFNTYMLYRGFAILLEKEHMDKIYYNTYIPFLTTLFKMERRGVTVDTERLDEMQEEITKDVNELEYKMCEVAGVDFNPSSSTQLSALLFGFVKDKRVPLEKQNREIKNIVLERDFEELRRIGFEVDESCYDRRGRIVELIRITTSHSLLEYSFGFKPLSYTKKGAPQCNTDVLFKLSKMNYKNKRKKEGVKLCELLSTYSKINKLKSAFVDGLKKQIYDDGKVHPNFKIIGTDSGRISCSTPNLQQLPKADDDDKYQIRSLFIGSIDEKTGKRKKIIALDYANLEMRILAHFSRDKNLLEMFENGDDTHGSTAVNMFNLDCTPEEVKNKYPHLRQASKVINFLLMYGGGANNLYNTLKDDRYSPVDLGSKEYLDLYKVRNGKDVAQIYIDKYFETYSGVAKFIRNQKRFAHKNGFVQTLLGRKRRLPDINSRDMGKVSYCERLSVNSSVQGSAADLTMSGQNRVDKEPFFVEHDCLMLLQVHDELVFECPEEYLDDCIPRIKALMEHPFGDDVELNLPMRADYDTGDSYQEAK